MDGAGSDRRGAPSRRSSTAANGVQALDLRGDACRVLRCVWPRAPRPPCWQRCVASWATCRQGWRASARCRYHGNPSVLLRALRRTVACVLGMAVAGVRLIRAVPCFAARAHSWRRLVTRFENCAPFCFARPTSAREPVFLCIFVLLPARDALPSKERSAGCCVASAPVSCGGKSRASVPHELAHCLCGAGAHCGDVAAIGATGSCCCFDSFLVVHFARHFAGGPNHS